jgi:hypothetical protein
MHGSPLKTIRRGGSLDGTGALLLLQQQQLEAGQEAEEVIGGGMLQEFASHTLRHAKEVGKELEGTHMTLSAVSSTLVCHR